VGSHILRTHLPRLFGYRPMDSGDAHYVIFDFPTPIFVVAAAVTSKTTAAHIKADLMNRVFPNSLRAKQYPAYILGKAYWAEDPNFNIDNHLITVKQSITTLDELGVFAGSVAIEPVSTSKPLWCCYVVEDFQGGSAVIVRFHHSYMDGVSMVNALVHNSDPTCPRVFFTLGESNSFRRFLTAPLSLMLVLFGLIAGMRQVPDRNPLMGIPYSGNKAIGMTQPFPLGVHLARAKALGVTFNDYITAAVLRTVSAYIAKQHSTVQHHFTMGIPITLRGNPSDGSPLPAGNDISYFPLSMPDVTSSTLEKDIGKIIKEIKAFPPVTEFPNLTTKVMTLFPKQFQRKIFARLGGKETFMLSNMSGPKALLSYDGVHIKSLFVSPIVGIPIAVAVVSYAEHFTLTFTTDIAIIKDPSALARLATTQLTST